MNLKFVFGKYDATQEKEWNLENNKVKDVLECIAGNRYYPKPEEYACDERTVSVMETLEDNSTKCVGMVHTTTSFRTEVLIDIVLHPSVTELPEEKGKEYYIAIHNKLENILREIGYTEMKDWVLDDEENLNNIYKELGYQYLDGSINGLGEPSNLLSKRLI